ESRRGRRGSARRRARRAQSSRCDGRDDRSRRRAHGSARQAARAAQWRARALRSERRRARASARAAETRRELPGAEGYGGRLMSKVKRDRQSVPSFAALLSQRATDPESAAALTRLRRRLWLPLAVAAGLLAAWAAVAPLS